MDEHKSAYDCLECLRAYITLITNENQKAQAENERLRDGMSAVYEVVDATYDEMYWSHGVYTTQELALASLDVDEPPTEFNGDWDVITCEVRHRPLDAYSSHGRTVATVTWTRQPIEDDDTEDRWERAVEVKEVLTGGWE